MQVNEIVTSKIIEKLEAGTIPWQKPWIGSPAINYVSRKPYTGINVLLLDKGGEFATFKQIQSLGGTLKKGSKASMVVFYKQNRVEDEEGKTKTIPILRYYNVFHLSDSEGIPSKLELIQNTDSPIEQAEQIITNYKDCPEITEDPGQAWYMPSTDKIGIPNKKQFKGIEEYYSTLYHEICHSTGHINRLKRFTGEDAKASFGSESYSKEELIAEIGSAILCCHAGIEKTIDNSASYIQSWLKVLKNDKNFIIQASSKAQKAVDYILQ